MKKSIVFYETWATLINNMPVAEAGQLIKMICEYSFNGETLPSDNDLVDAMFAMIKAKLDEDAEAYDEAIKKRSEGGKKAMKKRWESVTEDKTVISDDKSVITPDKSVTNKITPITDTVTVTDTVSKDIKKNTKKKFVPPTLEEVKAYCEQRNSPVDPKQFYDYFTAGNWVDSKGQKVTSWKQKLLTWEGYNKTDRASPPKNDKTHFALERNYDFEELEKKLIRS